MFGKFIIIVLLSLLIASAIHIANHPQLITLANKELIKEFSTLPKWFVPACLVLIMWYIAFIIILMM